MLAGAGTPPVRPPHFHVAHTKRRSQRGSSRSRGLVPACAHVQQHSASGAGLRGAFAGALTALLAGGGSKETAGGGAQPTVGESLAEGSNSSKRPVLRVRTLFLSDLHLVRSPCRHALQAAPPPGGTVRAWPQFRKQRPRNCLKTLFPSSGAPRAHTRAETRCTLHAHYCSGWGPGTTAAGPASSAQKPRFCAYGRLRKSNCQHCLQTRVFRRLGVHD
jgi:hypothetical protein